MKFIFAFILFLSINSLAFENANLQFQDPSGWVKQPTEAGGVNAIYFSVPQVKAGKTSAILLSTTTRRPNKMKPDEFAKQSLATEAKKYKDYKVFGIKNLADLKSDHVIKQFTYTKNNIKYKGLVLLAQSKSNNHLFHFTVGEEFYPTYEAEVLSVLKSVKIKK